MYPKNQFEVFTYQSVWTLLFILLNLVSCANSEYDIGVGIADVTGPIAEITFMGYGKLDQKGTGLHLRQWARTFIISDGIETIVFVSVDIGMIGDGLRLQVIKNLQQIYGPIYNLDNVCISGTHTHSAPGGFLMHFLFDLTIRGFSKETFNGLVEGIVQSIRRAHENKQRGKIFFNSGEVFNANINRSPTAYLQNPQWERAMYKGDTDTELVQLKFFSSGGDALGVINWFPVHPTSMNNTNTLVSSDNVGFASIKFEKKINFKSLPGRGPFVAAFASSNLGDVSPNINGPRCVKTGLPCDMHESKCPGSKDSCIAFGPGRDMFESTAIIADRLFQKAWELWLEPSEEITGPIKIIHQYVDMPKAEADVIHSNGNVTKVRGCVPAMGYSFAAGTTDGPGAFSFHQGTVSTNPMWNLVRNILARPKDEDVACHSPKPILLATGRMTYPFDWQPSIVSTQLALLGNVAIAAVPGEFTTMSGRRLKNFLKSLMAEAGFSSPKSIIAGLCNTYSDYITTFEEYQVQRYEGASTIFGPHTLNLYLQQYRLLMNAILRGIKLDRGPEPQGLGVDKLSLIPPVVYDLPRMGYEFGSVLIQPVSQARPGQVVKAQFVSGNPRNNLMHGGTFCTIERMENVEPPSWIVEATDADWETKVLWNRSNVLLGYSETEIQWTIPKNVVPGIYRIKHFGYYKSMMGGIHPYSGTSETFQVLSN